MDFDAGGGNVGEGVIGSAAFTVSRESLLANGSTPSVARALRRKKSRRFNGGIVLAPLVTFRWIKPYLIIVGCGSHVSKHMVDVVE
jgi:hypothetical protein